MDSSPLFERQLPAANAGNLRTTGREGRGERASRLSARWQSKLPLRRLRVDNRPSSLARTRAICRPTEGSILAYGTAGPWWRASSGRHLSTSEEVSMRLRTMVAARALGAVLLLGGATARAQSDAMMKQRTTIESKSELPKADQRQLTITVKEVDPVKHVALLQVVVSPEANITSNGNKIRLDELKPGDSIRASFDPKTEEVIELDVLKHSKAR
jgi:hypothetical protein